MSPASLIPTPDSIPVHWSLFHILLLVTFLLHILFMNIMVGTAFIAAFNHFTKNGKASPPAKEISEKLPFAIAFAVNFGVAPLLFIQVLYGHFIYASSILIAVYWLSIIAILIGAYYLAYVYKYTYDQLETGRALVAGAITTLLLIIGFIFCNNFTLMLQPERWCDYFNSPNGLLLNLSDPTLLPRYLHFMTSAVAVGGLSIALFFTYKHNNEDSPWIKYGYDWFIYTTAVNFAVGGWFLNSIPRSLLEVHDIHSTLLILFLFSGIILAGAAMLFAYKHKPVPTVTCTISTIILMILVRDMLRTAYLRPYFSPSDLSIQPAYSPFFIFLIAFIGGILLIIWMLKLVLQDKHNREAR